MSKSKIRTLTNKILWCTGISAAIFFIPLNCARAEDFSLTIDKYYSPYMGANWMIAGLRGYQAIDDLVASGTVGNTSMCMSMIRFGKWALLDLSVANFASVLQHEVFGHGARAREFKLSDIGYHINLYRGKTTYSETGFDALNVNQKAAVSTGGVEATSILAQQLEQTWMRNNFIDSRAASMYLVNALDQTVYAFSTSSSTLHPDNDANAYISYVNQWQGNNNALTPHKLKVSMLWSWLDPMLYLSAYSIVNYIWLGKPALDFDTLHIGESRFMPTTNVLFAPWGPEFQLRAHLVDPDNHYLGAFLRYGRTNGKESYGFDIWATPFATYDCWYLINKLSAWYQPHLMQPSSTKNKYGFAEFLGAYFKVAKGIYFNGELGYKVTGYLPGTPLARGVVWRVGFSFDLNLPAKKAAITKI